MIRELTCYRTADGKTFDTADKANEHALDAVREILSNQLKPMLPELGASAAFKIVMTLLPDPDAAAALHGRLATWMEY